MTIFSQEKEYGMIVEIKDEMTVEVFISVFLSDNFFSVSMQRSNFLKQESGVHDATNFVYLFLVR